MSSCDKAYNAAKQIHAHGHVTVIFLYLSDISDLSVFAKRHLNECSVPLRAKKKCSVGPVQSLATGKL